ncbi:MAG: B12-binding domain-containing radical SAM protein [Gemmatimonadales bacterium]
MRVLLVQPPQGSRFGISKILMVEPLGLECVGSALEARQHEVSLVDLRLDRSSALQSAIRSARPGLVGISCAFTTDVYGALVTAKAAKEAAPNAAVVVGGHHASLIPGDFLFPGSPVDAVVIGEGEVSAVELAQALEDGRDPAEVPGVMTADNWEGGFESRKMTNSLDDFPLPDRTLSLRYRRLYHQAFKSPVACVETSRGCPFDCNFCSVWVFYQRRARRRSPERILEDLERVRALGDEHVFFTDDIAFLQRDTYERLGHAILDARLELEFIAETRADLVVRYRDLFPLWSEVGMRTMFLGIERVDDAGLEAVRKRTKGGVAANVEAIEILRNAGIKPMTSLITDPSWGEDDFDRLEEFVKLARLPNPAFTILTPLPGTELWESTKSHITTDDYCFFDVQHAVLPTKLPIERFYERFARLFNSTDANTRFHWKAVRNAVKLVLRGKGFTIRKVFRAVRDMRDPNAYMTHPGSVKRPDFLPPNYGRTNWIEHSQSALAQRLSA